MPYRVRCPGGDGRRLAWRARSPRFFPGAAPRCVGPALTRYGGDVFGQRRLLCLCSVLRRCFGPRGHPHPPGSARPLPRIGRMVAFGRTDGDPARRPHRSDRRGRAPARARTLERGDERAVALGRAGRAWEFLHARDYLRTHLFTRPWLGSDSSTRLAPRPGPRCRPQDLAFPARRCPDPVGCGGRRVGYRRPRGLRHAGVHDPRVVLGCCGRSDGVPS